MDLFVKVRHFIKKEEFNELIQIMLDIRSNSIFCSNNQSVKLADISYNKRLHGNDQTILPHP